MKERRKYKRLAIKLPVKWKSEGHAELSTAEAFLFDTHNIATTGLFLKTILKIKKGSLVDLGLKLNNKSAPLNLKAKVVWVAKKGKHPHLYPGIGIEFINISQNEYERLNTFMKNKLSNFRDARELKDMYINLKNMASRLVELEERHSSATHFKKVIDDAIGEIDEVAHILDREINEIKKM